MTSTYPQSPTNVLLPMFYSPTGHARSMPPGTLPRFDRILADRMLAWEAMGALLRGRSMERQKHEDKHPGRYDRSAEV